jgi:hypothetical protein
MILHMRLAALAALPLMLAACQGEKKPAEASTAQGEILDGSASDAMLPLDTVRSQPPLAPEATESGKPGKEGKRGDAPGDASEAASDAAEAPVAAAVPSRSAAPAPAPNPAQ